MDIEERALRMISLIPDATYKPIYAGNSGGKDSAIVDYLLQKSGIKYHSYYTNTTIDPPGTIGHIRKYYPHTQILQPKLTFYQLVEKRGLPTRLTRYCCEALKEYGSIGKIVLEGVRSAESSNRANRDYIQCDTRKWQKGCQHIYPIYDWTDDDVWNFIEVKKIKLPPSYEHLKRLGCVGCPLVSRKGARQKEFDLYPRYFTEIKKAIQKGMNNNPQWKLTQLSKSNSEIAMAWWLSGKTMNEYFNEYKVLKSLEKLLDK